jgi:hypothetical protein
MLPELFEVVASVLYEAAEAWLNTQSFQAPQLLNSPFTQLIYHSKAERFIHTLCLHTTIRRVDSEAAQLFKMLLALHTVILRVQSMLGSFFFNPKVLVVGKDRGPHRDVSGLAAAVKVEDFSVCKDLICLVFDISTAFHGGLDDPPFWELEEGTLLETFLEAFGNTAKE